jgi:hypothetical protein
VVTSHRESHSQVRKAVVDEGVLGFGIEDAAHFQKVATATLAIGVELFLVGVKVLFRVDVG